MTINQSDPAEVLGGLRARLRELRRTGGGGGVGGRPWTRKCRRELARSRTQEWTAIEGGGCKSQPGSRRTTTENDRFCSRSSFPEIGIARKPCIHQGLERVRRIELPYAAWEAAVLPLNYTRDCGCRTRAFIARRADRRRSCYHSDTCLSRHLSAMPLLHPCRVKRLPRRCARRCRHRPGSSG
jgi:hypothetical protein